MNSPTAKQSQSRKASERLLSVPLMREDAAIGALFVRRREVQPFNQKQIDLLTIFADQAVIAIGNARLFEEVQARKRELQESLEQQSATARFCGTISTAPYHIQPVFEAIVETRLGCARLITPFVKLFRMTETPARVANNAGLRSNSPRRRIRCGPTPLGIGKSW